MRLALCAVVGLLGAVCANGQGTFLDGLVGRDLWKDKLAENEQARLDRLIGKVPKIDLMKPWPWRVWKTHSNGQVRFVVFLGKPLAGLPDGSSACVVLLDGELHRLNRWSFKTGWRSDLKKASFEFSASLGSDMIVLDMTRMVNGHNVAKEYFAIGSERLRLVRIENDKGEAVQNDYIWGTYEIGSVPAGESEEEWVAMLRSPDKPDILSALISLGGVHIAPGVRRKPDKSKYASLFLKLTGSPQIRGIIAGLAHSDDVWIRQAAELALRGPRERRRE